jgi:phosphodiesterase/alkaline phosphatase D-like protein
VPATRREAIHGGAWLAAAGLLGGLWPEADADAAAESGAYDAGRVRHLLPTVTHDRLRLKASLARPADAAPRLRIDGRRIAGRRSDPTGRFWHWDVAGLRPGRRHELRLLDARGRHLAEPWRVRTFPAPNARPRHVRLLIYTCAGGNDVLRRAGYELFQPVRVRNRLLRRGLDFRPDAVIANGDQVYWDLEAGASHLLMGGSEIAKERVGEFRPTERALSRHNEQVLLKAAGPQIVPLYGTECRSVPTFFLTDDHDYWENDEANDEIITFPPPRWKLQLARATQRLYYPELLPVPGQPGNLPWMHRGGARRGLSECFGALRYGRLLEFLMYDVRRTLTLAGASAVTFSTAAERWVRARIGSRDTTHVVNMPSNPFGYSAGKWGEWYPDVVGDDGRLTTSVPKPHWQSGWLAQHDRLIDAIASRRRGVPLVVGGDLHATAAVRILRSGAHDLRANPVHVVLSGTLGTSELAFPSAFRGTAPKPPAHLDVEERIAPIEENGFMLADFFRDRVVLRLFRWDHRTQSEREIDALRPFRTMELASG